VEGGNQHDLSHHLQLMKQGREANRHLFPVRHERYNLEMDSNCVLESSLKGQFASRIQLGWKLCKKPHINPAFMMPCHEEACLLAGFQFELPVQASQGEVSFEA